MVDKTQGLCICAKLDILAWLSTHRAGCEQQFVNHPLCRKREVYCLRQSFASSYLQNISTKNSEYNFFLLLYSYSSLLIDLISIKIIKGEQETVLSWFWMEHLLSAIIKYKLFSTSLIRLVRSPHWHWHSGLDMLSSCLTRWIRGCLYFYKRGILCLFPLLRVIFHCYCYIHKIPSFPVNTHHSFVFDRKTDGTLGVIAKKWCLRIISVSHRFTWRVKKTHKYEWHEDGKNKNK